MRILVLGATGMAGHTIALYLSEVGHQVTAFGRRGLRSFNNIIGDATDFPFLRSVIQKGNFDAVINAIGILNTDAENNKPLAVLLNSYLPHFLSQITENTNTKIVHMSTDCVFSGKNGAYDELSPRDGETFYDRSKALGEIVNTKDLTFRNSIIGPDLEENGVGLFNWFMAQDGKIKGYTEAIWTGVTTLTLAKAMEEALKQNVTGLYHLVNNERISKYDLLLLFNKHLKARKIDIEPCDAVKVDKSLINRRSDFRFTVPSYEQMILEMKDWIVNHKDLYPHYLNK